MIVFWMCAFLSVGIPHSQAATPECEEVDISLVIDRTMSVGEENYDTMLDAVKDLISEYDVSADKTLFSIMTFAGNATLRASLGDKKYQSNEALMQLLDEMKQNDELGMPTRIDNALKMVGDEVFVAKNGDRPEAPNIMIIFTDGTTHKDSEPYDTVLPALEDKGVQRIAVGIGEKRLDPDELAVIAGDKDRVLLAKDFNDLKNQLADITEAICNIDGGYTKWSKWSACSVTCGEGVRRRSRTCTNPAPKNDGKTCIEQNLGPPKQTQKCNAQDCPVPGGYTQWSNWGKCSKTCGGGVQRSSRTCTNPPPSGGGPSCTEQKLGAAAKTRKCNTQKCAVPGGYTEWSNWGKCSKTCGGGVQRSLRTCTNPPPSGGGPSCTEQKLGAATKTRKCNTQKCAVPGGYTQWSKWGWCSKTCGGGVQRRSRTCTNPPPSGGGPTCTEQKLGPPKQTRKCNTKKCAVPGGYTQWSKWGKCSKTCGGGVQRRSRTCTNPPPSGGGPSCTKQKLGPAKQTRKCNTKKCPVPGGYTQWSKWGKCSKTCGGGVQRRSRTCTNPRPSGGGPSCTKQKLGPAKQTRKCNTKKCPVPGGYTQWSKWGKCSKTCGGGVQRRSRTCTNPRPSGGGPSCTKQKLGPAKQTRKCNTKKCAVPGGYTQWSSWGKCSVTCGGGVQRSSRTCTNPPPSGGGPSCTKQKLGPASKTRKCNTQDCGVDGGWSAWSNPPCDKTCGGGKRVRRRTCTNPPPSGDGAACSGSSTKTESCNKQACPTPVPPPPEPCIEHLDVGVIIDSSNSITNNDYNTVRQFIIELARRLQISEAGTHMAILLYSYEAHTWHKFTEAQTIAAITSKANALPHLQGGTRTDRALELATADFFGWDDCGDRPDKPNVLLVLTDGDTNKGSKPFNQVTPPLDDASVRRVAIGIGNKVDYSELRQIASSNDDVLRVSGYEYLVNKLEAIMKLSCEEQVLGKCGNWASYGSCSKSCGGGTQVRTRSCPLNSLHSKKQKKHCNDNLCPGQQSCEDKLSDCPLKAAKGDCWKTAKPPILGAGGVIKYSANRNYPMWDSCKKSCQRCDVDQSCFDEDPYNCPTQIGYLSCRSLFGIAHCKKTCNRCGGWGRR